ncbi:putative oxidoreductase, NAD(P)-binding domain [Edwardsiella piscicida]|nr:hypothetical protein QY76_13100 [Edwardsiella sp. EA181011]RFT03959.1 hypothetical protein CGL57_09520 [Edwardsiella anguillarum]GAJ66661.1 putative oxidoreductase, NAD(P)-binding domain [Edwardsiella piscicida]
MCADERAQADRLKESWLIKRGDQSEAAAQAIAWLFLGRHGPFDRSGRGRNEAITGYLGGQVFPANP